MKTEFYKIRRGRALVWIMRRGKEITLLHDSSITPEFLAKAQKEVDAWMKSHE